MFRFNLLWYSFPLYSFFSLVSYLCRCRQLLGWIFSIFCLFVDIIRKLLSVLSIYYSPGFHMRMAYSFDFFFFIEIIYRLHFVCVRAEVLLLWHKKTSIWFPVFPFIHSPCSWFASSACLTHLLSPFCTFKSTFNLHQCREEASRQSTENPEFVYSIVQSAEEAIFTSFFVSIRVSFLAFVHFEPFSLLFCLSYMYMYFYSRVFFFSFPGSLGAPFKVYAFELVLDIFYGPNALFFTSIYTHRET